LTLLYGTIGLTRELSVYWYFVGHQMKISSWSHGSNKQYWIASCSWLYGPNTCLKNVPLRLYSNTAYSINLSLHNMEGISSVLN
jgi:hypothetical protein